MGRAIISANAFYFCVIPNSQLLNSRDQNPRPMAVARSQEVSSSARAWVRGYLRLNARLILNHGLVSTSRSTHAVVCIAADSVLGQ